MTVAGGRAQLAFADAASLERALTLIALATRNDAFGPWNSAEVEVDDPVAWGAYLAVRPPLPVAHIGSLLVVAGEADGD